MTAQQVGLERPPTAVHDDSAILAAAREVVGRPEYDLQRAADPPSGEWIGELLSWVLAPLIWFFEAMEGLPDAVRWAVVIALALVVLLLVAHIIWTLTTAMRPPRLRDFALSDSTGSSLSPSELAAMAKRAAESDDHIGACRLLLRATLALLQIARDRRFRPGITNHELVREYATTPVAKPLRQLVGTIDTKWYGDEPCSAADYTACEVSHNRIRDLVRERGHAANA